MATINVTAYNDSGYDHTFAFRDGNTLADLGTYPIVDQGTKTLTISANDNSGQGRLGYRKADPGANLPGWNTTNWLSDGDYVPVG